MKPPEWCATPSATASCSHKGSPSAGQHGPARCIRGRVSRSVYSCPRGLAPRFHRGSFSSMRTLRNACPPGHARAATPHCFPALHDPLRAQPSMRHSMNLCNPDECAGAASRRCCPAGAICAIFIGQATNQSRIIQATAAIRPRRSAGHEHHLRRGHGLRGMPP